MKKPIKAIGMALYAMAVLVAVDSFWRHPKSAAGDYEEFSGSPVFAELKVIFGSTAPSSNTDLETSGFALNVDLAALNTREVWGGGSAGKEIAPDVAVADISGCA